MTFITYHDQNSWNGSAGGELVQYDGTNSKVLTYTRQRGSSKVKVSKNSITLSVPAVGFVIYSTATVK